MSNWAIIKTGGKQYKVAEGEKLAVEKIDAAGKDTIQLNEVLLVKKNGTLKIGKPLVANIKVKAKILENFKDKKIRVVKFKSKSRYLRTRGHRQQKTKILIEKISV
ncbi:50S ribosomal protein L21 [Candidatus Curtissbacteria bacterium RIFCSPLOWO2_01_FULL_41_18]|uniref:Large ribosomal subunit protein bL21 n=1 Tax=Candidatus Curtissbacteria bacterium RIFCSPLOWO2_01_FULL_41_18 TaxID=1797727 RepID=A0A1F5HJS1_9BACT|nr:MAG: 50S ribosomal protein L21 [Candidatus Curtissbacteria bacterium RIFCSPLOWO2_01_FULL_41_18]